MCVYQIHKVRIKVNNIKANNLKAKILNKYFHRTNKHMKTFNFIRHSGDTN